MPWNDKFRSPKSLGPKTFYISGMILVILGIGSVVTSIDPRPLSRSSWVIFLIIGLFFIVGGSLLLILVTKMKPYSVSSPTRIDVNDTVDSAADLLNDNLYSESADMSHATYQNSVESLESVKAVNQCMMTQSGNAPSPKPILFYKETFV